MIKFEHNINIVSLAALILSLVSVGWHALNYWAGPQVIMVAPDHVFIGRSDIVGYGRRKLPGARQWPFVHVAARLSYINGASADYGAVIIRERMVLEIGGTLFENYWFQFGDIDIKAGTHNEIDFKGRASASAFEIEGGASKTHETLFQPWPIPCPETEGPECPYKNYLPWNDFMRMLEDGSTLTIEFYGDTVSKDESVKGVCSVAITPVVIEKLAEDAWAGPLCKTRTF
jgi:hypothetical protein